ncbi:MAG TPA: tetratricopeptide repeat protein [Thermoflexales bacterium]|nr:tetratricopeptide repeat protein [Thermoflexales bacterium]
MEGKPFIFLFYGEGGMGKTTLVKRLQDIVTNESPFENGFRSVWIDWEVERQNRQKLQVGHDSIQPEAIFQAIYDALKQAGHEQHFKEYLKVIADIVSVKERIEKALRSGPETQLDPLFSELGAEGLMYAVKQIPGASAIPDRLSSKVQSGAQKILAKGGDELATRARGFVERILSKPHERDLFSNPSAQMAQALGKGIANITKSVLAKPMVLFLDTYEIADTPACDYALRQAIETSGGKAIWVISGRKNLAESVRGFNGYRSRFNEDVLYSRSLIEFSAGETLEFINLYAEEHESPRKIAQEEAQKLADFTLGIPYAVECAARMWVNNDPLEQIIAPITRGGQNPHKKIVDEMSERFLVHCVYLDEADRVALEALALQRGSNVAIVQELLNTPNSAETLRSLQRRHGFLNVDTGELADKLRTFLQESLLSSPIRRATPALQEANARVLKKLSADVDARTAEIGAFEEATQDKDWAEMQVDMIHHSFWKSEEEGWRRLLPLYLLGCAYDTDLAENALQIAKRFMPILGKDGTRRLRDWPGLTDWFGDDAKKAATLEEMQKLARHGWLQGDWQAECENILTLQNIELFIDQKNYEQGFALCKELRRDIAKNQEGLKKRLARQAERIGDQLGWTHSEAVPSTMALQAYEFVVDLDPKNQSAWYGFGVQNKQVGFYDKAIKAYEKAIALDPKLAYPHNGLGNVYSDQGDYPAAINAYEKAIALDPKFADPHYRLGSVYSDQGDYPAAINAYEKAIALDPKDAYPHHGLGIVYRLQGDYPAAINAYEKAIDLDPKYATPHNGLGLTYLGQGKPERAIDEFNEYLKKDKEDYSVLFNLGLAHGMLGQPEQAKDFWRRGMILCQGQGIYDKVNRALYTLALGDAEDGLGQMRGLIANHAPKGLLQEVLDDARFLARGLPPPARLDEMIALLESAVA